MRFEKGRKETTRKRIIDVASRRFRREGASATGLAGIMAEAGLTNGAFYPHFESKEALFREVLADALADQHVRFQQDKDACSSLEGAIRRYLTKEHLENWEDGCPSAALLPEIGRQPKLTREAYKNGLLPFISTLAQQLPDPESEASNRRVLAIFGLMVGTLQMARAVRDFSIAEDILKSGMEAALILAKDLDPTVTHPAVDEANASSPRSPRSRIRKPATRPK
ncbi:TetR/AcrR family transcriptional regulator [Paraburkholderia sp. BCC1885]|uniref:TetR/AcrR family transcriptional regulator n=1 Tax=Paraburkholderia sp. BCC1885 TaxID=2562669 RepID=UPI001181E554|nr:TetR family transcriptional regulator [Paraburkholderia sp. BCC1885]